MKKTALLFTLAMISRTFVLHAHSHRVVVVEEARPVQINVIAPANPIVVQETPPALIQEEISPSPGPNYYCIKGYWQWDGRWVWRKHEWVIRPSLTAEWDPPHWRWSHHHRGYIYEQGHWK